MWPSYADDDDTCFNVSIGLWPQNVLTSTAQESTGRHRRAQERPRVAKRPTVYDAVGHFHCTIAMWLSMH